MAMMMARRCGTSLRWRHTCAYRLTVKKKTVTRTTIGWREWIRLPELCETPIKVKVDTGAQTSALHAFRLRIQGDPGSQVATFVMHPHQRTIRDSVSVTTDVIGFRKVRSSNGKIERRPVIRVDAILGDVAFPIELTLTRRDEMGFRMLLGRSAVSRRFVIDPARSYVTGRITFERGEEGPS